MLFRTIKIVLLAILQACIINTKLEIWGGGGALAPSAPVLPPSLALYNNNLSTVVDKFCSRLRKTKLEKLYVYCIMN